MAKLYFRYGTVGSAKTLNLLAVAHNYRSQKKRVVLLKPAIDTRFGINEVKSRAGLSMDADYLLHDTTDLDLSWFAQAACVLVDEVQFLPARIVEQLRNLTIEQNIPVICYGLRTDFRCELFAGSKRLLELADSIEEVKTTCHFCNRKAIYNLRIENGVPTLAGPSVELGADEKYLPSCPSCYRNELQLNPNGFSFSVAGK